MEWVSDSQGDLGGEGIGEREKKVRSCQGGVLCEQKGGGGRNERVDVYGLVALEMSSKEIEGEE